MIYPVGSIYFSVNNVNSGFCLVVYGRDLVLVGVDWEMPLMNLIVLLIYELVILELGNSGNIQSYITCYIWNRVS